MSQPISVDILSDSDDEPPNNAVATAPFSPQSKWQITEHLANPECLDARPPDDAVSTTPFSPQPKRQRIRPYSNPTTILVIDDDDPSPYKAIVPASTQSILAETPLLDFSNHDVAIVKSTSKGLSDVSSPDVAIVKYNSKGLSDPQKLSDLTLTPSIVAETPMSDFSNPDVGIVNCTSKGLSDPQKFSGICGLICLESDNESEIGSQNEKSEFSTEESLSAHENLTPMSADSSLPTSSKDGSTQANDDTAEEIDRLDPTDNILKRKSRCKGNANKENDVDERAKKRNKIDEESIQSKEAKNELREREKLQKVDANFKRLQLKEEKKLLREREKSQKAAMKAEAVELKKLEKEKQKWEKGKLALKSIVAKVDSKVVELGSVGGHLLTRFAEKGLTYRITSNPIERSIVWNMAVPDQISKFSSNGDDIPYVLLVVEAEEFCNLVINETLMEHVSHVRSHYPSHTICYVTNRLMAYINKREQEQYKSPDNCSGWKRPPVEEVLSKLATHFLKVHSRQCIDEAELAEHVVGLTCSLASCRFRKKLTQLSVNANGSLIPKDCIDKDLFKKNSWLKALIAIPKVQPRFALAIRKKYPTMKSLLSVYMDPNKSVHEKEFLLKNLTIEGLLGDDRRLGEVCSKRVYRILTAQCGTSNTDDVEDGADFFSRS